MPSILDGIRAALRKSKPTLAQLAEAVAQAGEAQAAAQAEVERQTATVAANFLDDDAKRLKDRESLRAAHTVAEDATALLAYAQQQHAVAIAADDEAKRTQAYTATKIKADDVIRDLPTRYAQIVSDTLALLRDIAQADAAVIAVNDALPKDAVPLSTVDYAARATSWVDGFTEEDGVITAWGYVDGTLVPEDLQEDVADQGNGTGVLHVTRVMNGTRITEGEKVIRLSFGRTRIYDPIPGVTPSSLAATITLPALFQDAKVWDAPPYDAAHTVGVVDAAERAHAETSVRPVRPSKAKRPFRVEYRPIWPEAELARMNTPRPSPYLATNSIRADAPRQSRFGASPLQ